MYDDIKLERVLEAIYDHIIAHMPEEACESCEVTKMLGDLMVGIKKENDREIALELGFDCLDVSCPFMSVDRW